MTAANKSESGCHTCRDVGLTLLPLRPPIPRKTSDTADEKQQRQIAEAVARYLNQFSNGKQA